MIVHSIEEASDVMTMVIDANDNTRFRNLMHNLMRHLLFSKINKTRGENERLFSSD